MKSHKIYLWKRSAVCLLVIAYSIFIIKDKACCNELSVEIIETGRGSEKINLYGIQNKNQDTEPVRLKDKEQKTKFFLLRGKSFWADYFVNSQIYSEEKISFRLETSFFEIHNFHKHGRSNVEKSSQINVLYLSKRIIYPFLVSSIEVRNVSQQPEIRKSSSGVFNVTPVSATVEDLTKPHSKPFSQSQFFDLKQETGFTSPTFSLQLDSIKFDYKDIFAQVIGSYKPSIGSVDSGNDDFLLGVFLKKKTPNFLYGVYFCYAWIGDFKNISPEGSFIRTKDVFSAALHYSKAYDSFAISTSLDLQQNPMRAIDNSKLFGEWISSFNLGVNKRISCYSLSSTLGVGISGAVPDYGLSVGVSHDLE